MILRKCPNGALRYSNALLVHHIPLTDAGGDDHAASKILDRAATAFSKLKGFVRVLPAPVAGKQFLAFYVEFLSTDSALAMLTGGLPSFGTLSYEVEFA